MKIMIFKRKTLHVLVLIYMASVTNAQISKDTLGNPARDPDFGETEVKTSPLNKKDTAQSSNTERPEYGVAVSPSTIRFNAKPGAVQTRTVKVTNDTKREYNFQLKFQDLMYDPINGEEKAAKKDYRYALSRYLSLSPSYLQLKPRESKVISITANVPAGDSNAIALWTQLIIDQVFDRKPLEIPGADKNVIGLGIKAGMGFAVNIYQNPPNVKSKDIEVVKLKYNPKDPSKKRNATINAKVKNKGDGIGYCLFYIEFTNLTTGKQSKEKVKQFSILPGLEKTFTHDIAEDFPKGNYSALMVLDFGDPETIQSAEIDFKVE